MEQMSASFCHRSLETERPSSSSSDSENSDVEVPWKRRAIGKRTSKKMMVEYSARDPHDAFVVACQKNNLTMPKKRNTIWCSVLQEQGLTEDLHNIGVVNSEDRVCIDRSSESYHVDKGIFEMGTKDNTRHTVTKSESVPQTSVVNKRKRKLDAESDKTSWKIIKTLNEPNHDLIRSIVDVIGKEHSLDILHKTEDVESAGGMMTLNGMRRRTPGGVYIQLLKSDPNITKDQLQLIFQDENKKQELNRKQIRRLKRQSKPRKVARKLGKMEIGTQEAACSVETNRHEDMFSNSATEMHDQNEIVNEESNASSSSGSRPSTSPEEGTTDKLPDSEPEEGEVLD